MRELNRPSWFRAPSALFLVAAAYVITAATALAQSESRQVYDTFVATTTGMTPDGVTLRIVVREWPDQEARAQVVEALTASDDVAAALAELPSIGVLWRSSSGVGHALKYAYRGLSASGQEQLTFVTEKPIDSYTFGGWDVPGQESRQALDYTVVELLLDESGSGTGTLSLAADVSFDPESGSISLVRSDDTPVVLADAREQPKPYWAKTGSGD